MQNHDKRFAAFQYNSNKRMGSNAHGYGYYSEYLTDANRHSPLEDSPYWVLLSKTVLQDSWEASLSDRGAMVRKYGSHGYALPRALEIRHYWLTTLAVEEGVGMHQNIMLAVGHL